MTDTSKVRMPTYTLRGLSKLLSPYKGIRILSTPHDEMYIESFVSDTNLACSVCTSKQFKVKVLIEAEAVINTNNKPVLITELDPSKVHVVNLLECADCGCEVYTMYKKLG